MSIQNYRNNEEMQLEQEQAGANLSSASDSVAIALPATYKCVCGRFPISQSPNQSTSPAAQRLLSFIEDLALGRVPRPNDKSVIAFRLTSPDCQTVQQGLQENDNLWGFFCAKVRHAHFTDEGFHRIVIYMPHPPHEWTVRAISYSLDKSLDRTREDMTVEDTTRLFAKNIRDAGSSPVYVDLEGPQSRVLDASWMYKDCHVPSVVVKVAYSENLHQLAMSAYDYIIGTAGHGNHVRVVVGIDLPYDGAERDKKGPIDAYIWEAGDDPMDGSEDREDYLARATLQHICDEDGRLIEGSDIKLELANFGPSIVTKDLDDVLVIISSETLQEAFIAGLSHSRRIGPQSRTQKEGWSSKSNQRDYATVTEADTN